MSCLAKRDGQARDFGPAGLQLRYLNWLQTDIEATQLNNLCMAGK